MPTHDPLEPASGPRNRTYYAGDLRSDLIEAALEAVAESGPANVSLRDLARRLGVSHAAPKNHFADKRELFTVLATGAHDRLADLIDAAVAAEGATDPIRRLIAAGRAYLQFAREHPASFKVMWQEDMQNRSDPALVAASDRTFGPLVALAEELGTGEVGGFAGRDPIHVALVAWAIAHGVADLASGGALDDLPGHDDPARRDDELLDIVESLFRRALASPAGLPAASRGARHDSDHALASAAVDTPQMSDAIVPDDKDWTWVLDARCADCGFDAASLDVQRVGDEIRRNAAIWEELLAAPRDTVTARPRPAVWSTLEYAAHVRDVYRLFLVRLASMLDEDDPLFANWDQDAAAIADRYGEQDPAVVAVELGAAASVLADAFDAVDAAQWDRPGRRSDGASFTVASFARYLLHDPVHHVWDVTEGRPADG